MVTLLALVLLQAVAAPSGDAAFVDGRIDCHVVNRTADVLNMSLDLADSRVTVREGAGFVRNGALFEATSQDSSILSMRLRARYFSGEASGRPVTFELVDMVDEGFRAIRLTVLARVSVSMGHGVAMMQSRLAAIGMCQPASPQIGS